MTPLAAMLPSYFGEQGFWATIDAVAADRRAAGRLYWDERDWARVLAASTRHELPAWVLFAVATTREAWRQGWKPGAEGPFAAIVRLKNEREQERRAASYSRDAMRKARADV